MRRGSVEFLYAIAQVNMIISVTHPFHLRRTSDKKLADAPKFAWRRTQSDLRQFSRNDMTLIQLLIRVSEDFHVGDSTRADPNF